MWVFLLVSIAGLTEGKQRPFIVTQHIIAYVFMHEICCIVHPIWELTLWEVGVIGVDTLGDTSII